MPKETKEGSNESKNKGSKALRKQRLKRLFLILSIIFVIFAAATAITTYAAVKHLMKDLPEFDLALLEPAKTSFLYDKDGTLVTPLMGAENRILVTLDEMSDELINAFLAIEDDRFYEHPGFDARGIFRAAWNNITNKTGNTQGGSTITQQLVKNTFLTPERTIKRKVQEVYMAYQLEQVFSKDEILELYLNRIFFDYNAYGVEAAALTYFGKSAKDINLAEAAMLAGIPNLPAKYSPYRNFDEAKKRQAVILDRMAAVGMISQDEANAAKTQELILAGIPERTYPHPWFVDHVVFEEAIALLQTLPDYSELSPGEIQSKLYTSGLHIYTTLDQRIQQAVMDVVENENNYKRLHKLTQVAVVVAQPDTGYVSAIAGGRNYDRVNSTVFNRATANRRPAGSVLKPIVAYAPAFNEGIASPATVLDDAPGIFAGTGGYYPNNYDMHFRGLVTVRYSLSNSLNIPAIRLLQQLGVQKGKEYGEKMGITRFDKEKDGLAMVVGGIHNGMSAWETAQAFSVLANEGVRTDFTTITKIVDSNGTIIYEHEPHREEVLSPEAAWLTTSILIDTVRTGTATSLRIGRTVAAKTGTSDLARDAWMAAYTPDYVTAFWIGRDSWPDVDKTEGNYRSFEVTPGFMNPILKAVHEGLPKSEFKRPGSLRQASVCKKSGLRPGEHCPEEDIISDWFLKNRIPSETCTTHVELEVCKDSGLLVGEFCPADSKEMKVFYNRPEFIETDRRWAGRVGRKPADAELMPPTETCDKHTARPGDITSLKATQDNETGDVTLTWKAADGAVGYIITRKGPNDSEYILITGNPITALSYIDYALEPGTYNYTVTAVNDQGVKSGPISTSITVEPPPPPPDPPLGEEDPPPGEEDPPPGGEDPVPPPKKE